MSNPNMEILVWNQPARNVPPMINYGINTFVGPEVEDKKNLTPDVLAARSRDWCDVVVLSGAACILRKPWTFYPAGILPINCTGIIHSVDEPNGHLIQAGGLADEAAIIRSNYGVRMFLTLAGDKITSIKPTNADYAAQVEAYKAYAALLGSRGVAIIDWYTKNRNATRYPVSLLADAVKWYKDVTGGTTYAWWEANDQQLTPPTSVVGGILDINREPMPTEMQMAADTSIAAGATGGGWFLTCDSGKYGWGTGTPNFATRGDSYFPQVNRKGESMAAQYDKMKAINQQYGRPVPMDLTARLTATEANIKALQGKVDALAKVVNAISQATSSWM